MTRDPERSRLCRRRIRGRAARLARPGRLPYLRDADVPGAPAARPAGEVRMRWSARAVSAAVVVGAVLAVAACARRTGGAAGPGQETGRTIGGGSFGAIVAMRPIPPTGSGDPRASILRAVGVAAIGGAEASPHVVEFIIRQDDGRTISVVQPDALRLRPGERVAISGGAAVGLARAAVPPAP